MLRLGRTFTASATTPWLTTRRTHRLLALLFAPIPLCPRLLLCRDVEGTAFPKHGTDLSALVDTLESGNQSGGKSVESKSQVSVQISRSARLARLNAESCCLLCQAEQLTLQLPPASHAASASSSLLPSRPASSLTAAADASEWNLNGIARLPSGFLQHTHQSIPGVTAPMLCECLPSAGSLPPDGFSSSAHFFACLQISA